MSIGEWEGEGGKVQRISSIDDRWKIDRGRVRISLFDLTQVIDKIYFRVTVGFIARTLYHFCHI